MMSMIFDGFDSMDAARKFVAAVHERFGLDGQTFSSAEAADQHDLTPYELVPPIAYINRPHWDRPDGDLDDQLATEAAVEELVSEFGGEFIGT
jgi:hypothetical protein